jgi:hypothetical protein
LTTNEWRATDRVSSGFTAVSELRAARARKTESRAKQKVAQPQAVRHSKWCM